MYGFLDIGATHTRVSVSEDGQTLGEVIVDQTPTSYEQGLELIHSLLKQQTLTKDLQAVSIALAGSLDLSRNQLIASHLTEWAGKPLATDLSHRLQCPVVLENDANLAGLGEAVFGSGKAYQAVMYITVSSGVGGSLITNKTLNRGQRNFEPGRQIINFTDLPNGQGHLEDYVSGLGITQHFGQSAEQIQDEQIWQDLEHLLAVGIANSCLHWSPDCVILGGGLVNHERFNLLNLHSQVAKQVGLYGTVPEFVKAQLGQASALWGGLELLRQLNLLHA